MANIIRPDDNRLTAPQRDAIASKVAALGAGAVKVTAKTDPTVGHDRIVAVLHWFSGPRRLNQCIYPDGWRSPVGGDEARRGRAR